MSAFIGVDNRGIRISNGTRDLFLDWIAARRLDPSSQAYADCLSEKWRWMGCGIELRDILPEGVLIRAEPSEFETEAAECPLFPIVLAIVDEVLSGEWQHLGFSKEANYEWRNRGVTSLDQH